MYETERQQPTGAARPRLWSPNAAVNWSVLLTPAFGATLQAANWRALGEPERAKTNIVWVWVTCVFLVVNVALIFAPQSELIDRVTRYAGIGLLAGWYFSQGRAQAQFVQASFQGDYERRGWGKPLGVGFAALAAYVVVIFTLFVVTYQRDADEVAAEVAPLVLENWHKNATLKSATIQKLTLVHQDGDTYSGFVYATLAGRPERLPITVTHDGHTIRWEIKPPEE